MAINYNFENPADVRFKSLVNTLNRSTVDNLNRASDYLRAVLAKNRYKYTPPTRHAAKFNNALTSKSTKADLCTLIAACIGTKNNFMYFFSDMSQPVRQLCELMCLCEELEYSAVFTAIPELMGDRVWDGINSTYRDEASLFVSLHDSRYWYRHTFELPSAVGTIIWEYIRPDDYNVIFNAKKIDPEKLVEGSDYEKTIGDVLQAMIWAWKGGIKTTQAGYPALPAIKKLQPSIGVEEFYPALKKGSGAFQRSIDLAMMFNSWYSKQKDKDLIVGSAGIIKEIWENALKNHLYGYSSAVLMPDYKNNATADEMSLRFASHYLKPLGFEYAKDTKALDKWISVESMVKVIYWSEEFRKMCNDRYYNSGSLIYNPTSRSMNPQLNRRRLLGEWVNNTVALLYAWGLVECAYEKDRERVPSSDIRWYRLTKLGLYVFGFEKKCTLESAASSEPEWYADPQRTLLVARKDAPSSLPVISQLGKKITDRRYLIDAATIMTGSRSEKDISKAISTLKTILGDDIPEIWQNLFDDVERRKSIKVSGPEAYMSVQLPKDDPNLLRMCAADPVISEIAIKCEGARLMVSRKDYPKLLKALKALGYMTDFSYEQWQSLPHYLYS